MGARQFNERERPRAVLVGFTPERAAVLGTLLPEAQQATFVTSVFLGDFDLLVSWNLHDDQVAQELFVIAFGDGALGCLPDGRGLVRSSKRFGGSGRSYSPLCVAQEFMAPDEIPALFADLVASDLVPLLKSETVHSGIVAMPGYTTDVLGGVMPLLCASDGTVLAGHFQRGEGGGWCLSLPEGVDIAAWVTAAANVWHDLDPKRFPGRIDWTNNTREWDPPAVLAAAGRHSEAEEALIAAGTAEVAALKGYSEAKAEAADGPFGMLIQGGDPLVASIAAALIDLGFTVRDMDLEWPEGKRLEDLRIKTPDEAEWEALVEVKGYSRGYGKAADLVSIAARFAKAYRLAEKREPNALWYVVNQEPNVDPGARKLILDSGDTDIAVFAEADGLAISTVDLYRLWRDVQQAKLTDEAARRLLTHSLGRFAYAWATETGPHVDEPRRAGSG